VPTVAELVAHCPQGFTAAGAYETLASEVAVANTEGQFCWAPSSQASINTVVTGSDGGSGFAEVFAAGTDELDPTSIGKRAADKAVASRSPRDIDPGRYTVVLEPAAVSTLVGFLAWIGFGGRSLFEGRSCFSGKQDQQVAAPLVTIYDDALSDGTSGLPSTRRAAISVNLIEDGVFLGGVYLTSGTAGSRRGSPPRAPPPPPNPEGPFPQPVHGPGETGLEQMIASTERGLLVTRFHYTNVVHPVESTITGMTRDGTSDRGREIARRSRTSGSRSRSSGALGDGDDRRRPSSQRVLLLRSRVPALRSPVQLQRAVDH
jgi:predicted Zn-dependent protease